MKKRIFSDSSYKIKIAFKINFTTLNAIKNKVSTGNIIDRIITNPAVKGSVSDEAVSVTPPRTRDTSVPVKAPTAVNS